MKWFLPGHIVNFNYGLVASATPILLCYLELSLDGSLVNDPSSLLNTLALTI